MNVEAFRRLYEYHFAANRKLWQQCIGELTDEQFKRKLGYSIGSIRNQTVHIMNVDNSWFCELRSLESPGFVNPVYLPTRAAVRQRWDDVEVMMKAYLEQLQDDDLSQEFEKGLMVWQVLFHVLNHGTDHRSQILALLHQLDIATFPQDYIFFANGKW